MDEATRFLAEKVHRLEAEVERLQAEAINRGMALTAAKERARLLEDENERLRAVLSKGCERDPLRQCPNCRQALEEK
jgi:hypothetical protein